MIIDDGAKAELRKAVDYYERRHPGLGEDFLSAYAHALERIARDPESLPILEQTPARLGIRRILLGRFPYLVIFDGRENSVRVLAIAHTARRHSYWLKRRK